MIPKITLLFCILFIFSCSRKDSEKIDSKAIEDDDIYFSEIPKVELVKSIEPIIPKAILEQWDRNMWISKFGPPASERTVAGGVLMEYIQPGPYEASGGKLITGVIVALQNDKTVDIELHYTTFGMPSYLKP